MPQQQRHSAYKITHWDAEIRQLAAKALGEIAYVCPAYVCSTLMRIVPEGVISPSLATRHGCVMFAAEAVLSMSTQGPIAPEVAEEISQVVLRIETARMYRLVLCRVVCDIGCLLLYNSDAVLTIHPYMLIMYEQRSRIGDTARSLL